MQPEIRITGLSLSWITVKGGNFVTFFAQINFFLKNALR
jgi:hypothetical protein